MSLATNEKFIKFYGLEFWKTFINRTCNIQCTYMKVDFIIAAICWMNSTTRHITILTLLKGYHTNAMIFVNLF